LAKKKTTKKTTKKPKAKSSKSKSTKSKKSSKKLSKKNKELIKKSVITVIIIAAVIAVLSLLFKGGSLETEDIAAKVGDDIITMDALNQEYGALPDSYTSFVDKRTYLENSMIPQTLLSNEASGISDEAVETMYQKYLIGNNLTEEEVTLLLGEQGISLEKFKDLIKIQLYLNETLAGDSQVSDAEVQEFYEFNKATFLDENGEVVPFEEVEGDIKDFMEGQKLQEKAIAYVDELKASTVIEILYEEETTLEESNGAVPGGEVLTFEMQDDELCAEDGKPLVILFSTTWCPHCKWITDTFESVVKEYVDQGLIAAYHWEIDINDDTLTEEIETVVNPDHMALYTKYNPKGSIPTFVFGCQYTRIGNGYESQDDLAAEEAEFRTVIEALVA